MSHAKTIGISTGGGDCPGLNAVIRAVVKSAILIHGWRVIGIEDSFDGPIWPEKCRELKLNDVSGLLSRGGTILGTTNRGNSLCYPVVGDGHEQVRDFSDQVIRNAQRLGLDGLIVVGGDGTMKIALELYRKGLNLVGIPKTIDNDLNATEVSFGFDTALHTATNAIDKIHSSAESHHRIMVIEVMGREAGWIALESGLAAGADVILIPEIRRAATLVVLATDILHKSRWRGFTYRSSSHCNHHFRYHRPRRPLASSSIASGLLSRW